MLAAVPVAVTMAVPPMAKAAIGDALASRDGASIQAARRLAKESGAAISSLDQSHRYGSDRAASHHGQDDAA